ncbi:MAG: glyoxalase/bleomycin resistance/dioxygenase family protein [Gammaproteobacteria bacterium]|jgi:catechol 2,3-dioxygenase-like lactoylglutathione lyase family enzyme|nr:glyoxalase/bleomycin resistance/dioxygenase family protein [Gammaproteobacteria bacterium]
MKRLHVNLSVDDLDASVRFYSALFAAEPGVLKPDYARWMLDDPRVNFAISTRQPGRGVNHLGIQAEDDNELAEIHERQQQAGGPVLDEGETTCCYAHSTKRWITDPEGVAWETFVTRGEAAVYGNDRRGPAAESAAGSCC